MLARLHAWGSAAWLGLAGGAGLGFITRDVLQLAQPEVAFSWFAGATLGLASASRGLRERLSAPTGSRETTRESRGKRPTPAGAPGDAYRDGETEDS